MSLSFIDKSTIAILVIQTPTRYALAMLLAFSLFSSLLPAYGQEATYDLLIRGGRIVDGTGNPRFDGDVAIKNGVIVDVVRHAKAQAKRVIDATDLVVAPGFIDPHSHSDYTVLVDGNAESMVHDGVTLNAIGESQSVAPRDGLAPQTFDGIDVDWTHFGEYFTKVKEGGVSINLLSFVSESQLRLVVQGGAAGPATPAQMKRLEALTARSMEEGAWGLVSGFSTGGPVYPEETLALAKVAARYGGYYNTHAGGEGSQTEKEISFAIRVAEEADIPVEIYHLKILGEQNWGTVGKYLDQIETARARGLDVTANQYPYTAMYHRWASAFMPGWIREGGDEAFVRRLRDPAIRTQVKTSPEFKILVAENGGWNGIYLAHTYTDAHKAYEGKSLAEIAELRGDDDPAGSLRSRGCR